MVSRSLLPTPGLVCFIGLFNSIQIRPGTNTSNHHATQTSHRYRDEGARKAENNRFRTAIAASERLGSLAFALELKAEQAGPPGEVPPSARRITSTAGRSSGPQTQLTHPRLKCRLQRDESPPPSLEPPFRPPHERTGGRSDILGRAGEGPLVKCRLQRDESPPPSVAVQGHARNKPILG